jgi:hypothetical protein
MLIPGSLETELSSRLEILKATVGKTKFGNCSYEKFMSLTTN